MVVTEDALVILSPLMGLHSALAGQSRPQDIECHPDWDGRFPHSIYQINIKTFLENEAAIRSRTMLEADHSAVDARFLNVQWSSASWSKPGMGPNGSCFILATTSELDLFIFAAPQNAWTSEWKLLYAVDLRPVADLSTLDVGPSGQHVPLIGNDKPVFTAHRALVRKKQMATEVLCASFCHVEAPARFGKGFVSSSSPTQASIAYVIAGTRSGHIAIWECHPITGHCTFLSAVQVSDTGVQELMLTTQAAALEANAHARIAFQDADGIRLCDFYALSDQARIGISSRPPVLFHHCLVSAWHWTEHHFIYATVGRVHVYDVKTERTVTYISNTDPSTNYDPYSPAIFLGADSDNDFSVKVVLQDLREYLIPALDAAQMQQSPHLLHPIYPASLSGYPPLTETLQRKHDLHQAFLGYEIDPSSRLSSTSLVGAVRTNERVAFLGFNVSETIRYQMEVVQHSNVEPVDVLDDALRRAAMVNGPPPYLILRTILSLLNVSEKPEAFRNQLVSAAEQRWRSLLDTSPAKESNEQQHKQACLIYLLACRLELPSDGSSPLSTLSKRHKVRVLSQWLQIWLQDLTQKLSKEQASDEDQKLLLRLLTAGRMLPGADPRLLNECTAASSALNTTQASSVPAQDGAILTDESCAACGTQLTLSWDDHEQAFGWAKCQSGHVWRE